MHRGFVKLRRAIDDSAIMQNSVALHLFIHFLANAARKKRTVNAGGIPVSLEAGQLVVGRVQLSKLLNISQQKIRTGIKYLENLETITVEPTNRFSIITIVNWSLYQSPENEGANHVLTICEDAPAKEHQNTDGDSQPCPNHVLTNCQPTANHVLTMS